VRDYAERVLRVLILTAAFVGGMIIALSDAFSVPVVVALIGAVLWLFAIAGFFALVLRRERERKTGLVRSLGRGAKGALRFAWEWMP
jgi:hypothetical protein